MRFCLAVCLSLAGARLDACSCAPPPPPKAALEGAAAVFLGEAVEVSVEDQTRTARLKVGRWWKGGAATEVAVATHKSGATCGYGFEKGKRYLVYAHQEEGQKLLRVSLCSRTRTEAQADKDGDFKALGDGTKPAADAPREALAVRVEVDGDAAKVTVAFNYTGKPGDPATFQGVRLYRYEVPVGKGPAAVGWQGKDGRQTAVLGGARYHYYPAAADRQENGALAVVKDGDKVRVTGVYHAYGKLFVVDAAVKPGDPILLE